MAMEWSPPRKMGKYPSEVIASARPATSSQTSLTVARGFISPSFSTVSGSGVAALPRSSTRYPSSSRAPCNLAYRMAEGPMSTPRLSCPRSIGTPKIPGGLLAPSNKRDTSRAPRVGGGLEGPLGGTPDGVDAAEVHVRLLEGEHLPVAVEVARAGSRLVGEEVALGVEARGEDRGLERHPQVERVEALGVELGLPQGVVHRDAGAGDDEP